MIFFTFVLKDISINSYMETSLCTLGNDRKVCKYGKSRYHGDCLIEPGRTNLSILSVCQATIYEYE